MNSIMLHIILTEVLVYSHFSLLSLFPSTLSLVLGVFQSCAQASFYEIFVTPSTLVDPHPAFLISLILSPPIFSSYVLIPFLRFSWVFALALNFSLISSVCAVSLDIAHDHPNRSPSHTFLAGNQVIIALSCFSFNPLSHYCFLVPCSCSKLGGIYSSLIKHIYTILRTYH